MNEWLLIALMATITFGIRYLLLASASSWKLPEALERSLNYVPVAVLSAIVVQTILQADNVTGDLSINTPFLLSAVVAFVVARLSNSLMITVIAGLLFYWLCLSLGLAS
ncbi:MAG: AzlD domain-containing protein [Endozoicomonas sp.]